MTFDTRILAFAERFVSNRTFELIVAPAVADLQFEDGAGRLRRTTNRIAVLRAVAGGVRDDVSRAAGEVARLALLPACYYIFLLALCFDLFSLSLSLDFIIAATLILVLSFAPVLVCFWPERPSVGSID